MHEYWAGLPAEKLAPELWKRIEAYYSWYLNSGRLARTRLAWDTYYGDRGTHKSYQVQAAGEKGELSFLMSNEYRNLLQHTIVLATQSRPALECSATNTDVKSQAQTILGKGLIEYYRRDQKLDRKIKAATEIAVVMDLAWVFNIWDTQVGEKVRPDETGRVLRTGDVRSRVKNPLEVIYDFTCHDPEDQQWRCVKDTYNKYDLAAQWPEKAEEILKLKRDRTKDALYKFGDSQFSAEELGSEDDQVDVFTFYHGKTAALEDGRTFQVINPKLWLFDGPLPYRQIPGRRVCPTEMIMSAAGYSNANDLLGLQDCVDALISGAVTNLTNGMLNNIFVESGAGFDYEQLGNGNNLVQGGKLPEVINLAQLPAELLPVLQFLIGRMETIIGMNSVARGNVTDKNMSGAAMALLQSMALQFNSGLQEAYTQLNEDCGNDHIWMLQDYADEERIATIAGETKRWMLQKFTKENISSIHRVFCRISNPMAATTAGKLTIAENLIQMGVVKTADQYLQVLETGSLEPLIEDDQTDLMLIKDENEKLSAGEVPPVHLTDMHPRHIMGHRRCLGDPESRKDPELAMRVNQHLQMHIDVLSTGNPQLLLLLGMQPLSAPMMMPPGASATTASPAAGPPAATEPAGEPLQLPGPNMPQNALTGEQWNPQTGGLTGTGAQ